MRAPRIAVLLHHPTQFEGPLFQYAAKAGANLTVLYVSANSSAKVFDQELKRTVDWGIDLLSGYAYKKIPSASRFGWFWRELRASNYDCFIINGYSRGVYLMALAAARLRGVPAALRIDSVLLGEQPRLRTIAKRIVYGVVFRFFSHFFATSSLTVEYLRRFGVPADRIALFPYTVDTDYFAARSAALRPQRSAIRARYGIPPDARVVLAVAKLNAREAPWDLLTALEGIQRADVWTLIVGDGDQRAILEDFVARRRLKQVVFAGYVPYVDLVSMYVAADVFVHAAQREPWGVSVHEAIACNLAVVTSTHVGAGYDLIQPGCNGYMYQAGDAADLRDKLLRAIDELDAANVSRANASVLSQWNYPKTWDSIVAGCLKCMKE